MGAVALLLDDAPPLGVVVATGPDAPAKPWTMERRGSGYNILC